jgi:hypothetical protein
MGIDVSVAITDTLDELQADKKLHSVTVKVYENPLIIKKCGIAVGGEISYFESRNCCSTVVELLAELNTLMLN